MKTEILNPNPLHLIPVRRANHREVLVFLVFGIRASFVLRYLGILFKE